jgi:CHAD domain-containing protein
MPQHAETIDPLLDNLNREARRAVRTRSIDAVHDVRVSIRRLFQALELYKGAKQSRKPLRHIMKFAGDVRDCDIAVNLLRRPWAKNTERLRERISHRRDSARRLLAVELKKWIEIAAEWRAGIGAPKAGPAFPLVKMAEEFLQCGGRIAVKHPNLRQLHKFRIQTKELRYSIDLMQASLGGSTSAWTNPIQAVQKLLGQINDCRIVLDLEKLLGGGGGIESAMHKRIRTKIRKFRQLWREQFSGNAAQEWVRALEPLPRKPMARSRSAAATEARAAKRA